MARTVDKEGAERRRKQIVDAALHCFNKTGFHQTSMQKICKKAGLSPGTVYHYFKSKDAIITDIAEREVREAEEFAAHLEAAPTLEQGLAEAADAVLESNEYDGKFQVFMEVLCEAGRNNAVGRRLLKADGIAMKAIIKKLKQEKKDIAGVKPEVLAEYLGGQLDFLEFYKLSSPSAAKCAQMSRVVKQTLSLLLDAAGTE